MACYPDIYLLRHGQTEWNVQGRLQGGLDSALTPLGIAQAQAQGRVLAGCDLTGFRAVISPMGRARHTAMLAVAPFISDITEDTRLREIGVGDWAGRQRDELGVAYDPTAVPGETFALYEAAPNGEGLARLRLRCQNFLDDLDGPAVIVTHGITGHMLRILWLGWATERLGELPGGQGVVFHLSDAGHRVLTDD
jgi:probable phosphoglycerate mutase